jgi:hypothetical protein
MYSAHRRVQPDEHDVLELDVEIVDELVVGVE